MYKKPASLSPSGARLGLSPLLARRGAGILARTLRCRHRPCEHRTTASPPPFPPRPPPHASSPPLPPPPVRCAPSYVRSPTLPQQSRGSTATEAATGRLVCPASSRPSRTGSCYTQRRRRPGLPWLAPAVRRPQRQQGRRRGQGLESTTLTNPSKPATQPPAPMLALTPPGQGGRAP